MKTYIAGSLFKDSDIRERVYEEERLKSIGYTNIFNPITAPFNQDKTGSLPTSKQIFDGDTKQIIESSKIIAELDGQDMGVATEIGIAYGINYMLDLLSKATNGSYEKIDPNSLTPIDDILNHIPRKKIYGHATDIRLESAGKYDSIHVPYGLNQYFVGCVESCGCVYTDKNKMFKDLSE